MAEKHAERDERYLVRMDDALELYERPYKAAETVPPKHGSWLSYPKIETRLRLRQCPGKRRIPTLHLLRRKAKDWNRRMHRNRM